MFRQINRDAGKAQMESNWMVKLKFHIPTPKLMAVELHSSIDTKEERAGV